MFKFFNFKSTITHAINCFFAIKETPGFIYRHKLWNGFFEHKSIGIFTIAISAFFSYYLIGDLWQSFQGAVVEPIMNGTSSLNMGGIPEVSEETKKQGKQDLFSGGSKYLLLILLEVIIFYFSVRTLKILRNTDKKPGLRDFIRAEKRMVKVMVFNFIKGIFAQIMVYIALGILSLEMLRTPTMFLVYSYFIGYAFLDNYNEQFGKTLRESQNIIRSHFGAALTLGFIANILLYIPLIGPILVPVAGAIAGTIYAEKNKFETVLAT